MTIRGYEIGAKAIGAALVVAFIVFAVLWGPAACQRIRSLSAQNKVNTAQSGAMTNSAGDAVNTVSTVGQNEAVSDATTRSNERSIRDAEGSTDHVNPAVRDAGFASLCKRPSFRNSESGKLRCASAR